MREEPHVQFDEGVEETGCGCDSARAASESGPSHRAPTNPEQHSASTPPLPRALAVRPRRPTPRCLRRSPGRPTTAANHLCDRALDPDYACAAITGGQGRKSVPEMRRPHREVPVRPGYSNGPYWIRTSGLRIRSPTLYPSELRALNLCPAAGDKPPPYSHCACPAAGDEPPPYGCATERGLVALVGWDESAPT